MNRILLCNYCIEAIRSRGELVKVVEPDFITAEECEEYNTEEAELINRHIINAMCCDWCGEVDTLNSCEFASKKGDLTYEEQQTP